MRDWTVSDFTCCCLPTRFADQSSRVCPCFSFRPQRRDVSIWRFRFLRSCCVEWFSRWLVLRLFPLPCHVVCHAFVLARAALDRTGYASNSALSVVFLCQRLLRIYIVFDTPKKWPGGVGCPHFVEPNLTFGAQTSTEWGTCHKSRGFLYKIRVPNPFFLVHVCDFHNHWPLQDGKPGMSKHLCRIATWKKENRQKYKVPFCRGMMWKNLGLPVSPENFEMYKNPFCKGNFCSTFQIL